jgi:hypothetical protein
MCLLCKRKMQIIENHYITQIVSGKTPETILTINSH